MLVTPRVMYSVAVQCCYSVSKSARGLEGSCRNQVLTSQSPVQNRMGCNLEDTSTSRQNGAVVIVE